MRAEAYRSMADERGQVCHLQAAVFQVLVDRESRRRARMVAAIAARPGPEGGQFSGSRNLAFRAKQGYSATRECFLCHKRHSDNHFCDFRFHEPPYEPRATLDLYRVVMYDLIIHAQTVSTD